MYAIVDIAGQQFRVEKGQKIYVHRLEAEEGKNLDFEEVLLIDNDGKITIGEPVIKGAFVEGKVLTHNKGDKVIVFKKKRRKGYKVRNGHRQAFSHVEILSINEEGAPRKASKPEEAPKAVTKTESKAPAKAKAKPAAKESKPATKKATANKATTKPATADKGSKPAAKKASSTKTAAKPAAAVKKTTTKPTAKKTTAKKAEPKKATSTASKTKKPGDAKAK